MDTTGRADVPAARDDARGAWPGQPAGLVVSWCATSGVLSGGVWPGLLALGGVLSGKAALWASTILFLAGAGMGLLHARVLGVLGRPSDRSEAEARHRVRASVAWALPLLVPAWALSQWLVWSSVVMGERNLTDPALVVIASSWVLAMALCAWALGEGLRSVGNAHLRWSGYRRVTAVLVVCFVASVLVLQRLLALGWGVSSASALTIAFIPAMGVTVWLVAPPVIWIARAWQRWDSKNAEEASGPDAAASR